MTTPSHAGVPMIESFPAAPQLPVHPDTLREASGNVAAAVAVTADAPGVFEALWVTGTTIASQTHNPYLAAGLVTAGTFAVEGAAAIGTARLMAREKGQKAMGWVHKSLGKLGLRRQVETSLATDTAVAFAVGTPVMLAGKQALAPSRTQAENRAHGLKTAALTTAMAAPVNLAVAEGISDVSPTKVAVAGLAVAGLFAVRSKFMSRMKARGEAARAVAASGDEAARATIPVEATYDLTEQQCNVLERDLVAMATEQHGRKVTAVWIENGHPLANLVRTREQQAFPDIDTQGLFGEYEGSSTFVAMVDTRKGAKKGRVIRGSRLTGRKLVDDGTEPSHDIRRDGGSNMAMVRDMITDGEITGQEVYDYYRSHGIDLDGSVSIETNFRIGPHAPRRFGVIPMADLGHLTFYQHAYGDRNNQDVAVFAHVNDATVHSIGRIGITVEPFAGRNDLQTPAGPGSERRYDDKFHPVAMPNTGKTQSRLGALMPLAPPRVTVEALPKTDMPQPTV